jgi:hypothetical protein
MGNAQLGEQLHFLIEEFGMLAQVIGYLLRIDGRDRLFSGFG